MSDEQPPIQCRVKVDPRNANERALFRAHPRVDAIQIKFRKADWLLENDVADLVGPNQQLIVVEWEDGEYLVDRTPDKVFRLMAKIADHVDIAYLGDRWTYENLKRAENIKEIERSVEVQKLLYRWFNEIDAGFEMRPTILGWRRSHYEWFRELLTLFDTTTVGFDATSYLSKYRLRDDVNRLIDTLGVDQVYLNGRSGPTHLEEMPNEVNAFSGKHQLIKQVRVGDSEYNRELLTQEIDKRVSKLTTPQTNIRQFTTATS